MIRILNDKFNTVIPQAPKLNAIAVFSVNDAIVAFKHFPIEFVIVLDERDNTFHYCYSVKDVEQIFNPL